jgi:peptidyl-prolyl cis-trans isomerase C
MKKQLLSALIGAALLSLGASALAQNLAIVNGKPVPLSRVDVLSDQVSKQQQGRPIPPEMKNQIKDEVIAREVFMQEAQKRGLDAGDDFKNQMELARQTILIRELFTVWQKDNAVTDAEVKAEYDKAVEAAKAQAGDGKEYRARHILVEKEDEALKLVADLKKKAKFEDLAKKHSKDPGSGAKGGDLDWAGSGSYVKEFSDAMVKLKKGQFTETPVKSQFGYHIIRLDDERAAKGPEVPPMDQVKPQITQQLQQQKLAKYQEELRAKAKIE